MPRVFIAIPLSPAVRSTLAALPREDRRSWRWVGEEQFHITLKFLGEITETEVATAAEAVGEAVAATANGDRDATGRRDSTATPNAAPGRGGIALSARGIGAFPNVQRARVLWAGLAGEVDELRRVQAEIEARLARRGFPRDRRGFRPHITLARARGGRPGTARLEEAWPSVPDSLLEHRDRSFGSWTVTSIQVVESVLEPTGPKYIVRHEIPL